MTDDQFKDAFTAAGGWFILTQYRTISDWHGSKTDLVDYIFTQGFDADRKGSNTRVSSVLRLIDKKRMQDALVKIRDSKRINSQHPEAFQLANDILTQCF